MTVEPYTKDGISVVVLRAEDCGMSKCLRCRKYTHECRYDEDRGCKNLLCDRCAEVVIAEFPADPAVINFIEERKRIYGPQENK
jgi:hypothetical protein